jgi:CheY-like chemotaxis protein
LVSTAEFYIRSTACTGARTPHEFSGLDRLRIARALLGTTPEELGRQIGAWHRVNTGLGSAAAPTQIIGDLTGALRAIIRWHAQRQTQMDGTAEAFLGANPPLPELIDRYLTLRRDREASLAQQLGQAMSARAQPGSATPTPPLALVAGDKAASPSRVGSFLEVEGYDVERVQNADMALAKLAANRRFKVLVAEEVMPGMTGSALVSNALHRQPGLKVILIRSEPNDAQIGKLADGIAVLREPIRRLALIERVRSLVAA